MTLEQRTVALTLVLGSLFATFVACGSDDGSDDGSAPPPDFDGVYRPTTSGELAAIAFHAQQYAATPEGCAAESCTDVGSYTIDSAKGTLTLTSAKTQAARTLPLRILATKEASAAAMPPSQSSLLPRVALVTAGSSGGQIVSGTSGKLVSGTSGAIVVKQSDLITDAITAANINGQGMQGSGTGQGLQGAGDALGQLAGLASSAAGGSGGGGDTPPPPQPQPTPPTAIDCSQPPLPVGDTLPDLATVVDYFTQCQSACPSVGYPGTSDALQKLQQAHDLACGVAEN